MKAGNFAYARPADLAEAVALLGSLGAEGLPLAGGQSLMPAMNMRLAAPRVLVDIGRLAACRGIRREGDTVVVGALTTHSELLQSPEIAEHVPLLRKAAAQIAHVAIRNRGTIGGSLAYADPAAELPACAVALDATIRIAAASGVRAVKAEGFFRGLFQTALSPGDLIVDVAFPVQRPNQIAVFGELSRRRGDFALVAVAGMLEMRDADVVGARLAYAGCTDHAALAPRVSGCLVGLSKPFGTLSGLREAIAADLPMLDSPGLRAATRLQLAVALTARTLRDLQ